MNMRAQHVEPYSGVTMSEVPDDDSLGGIALSCRLALDILCSKEMCCCS